MTLDECRDRLVQMGFEPLTFTSILNKCASKFSLIMSVSGTSIEFEIVVRFETISGSYIEVEVFCGNVSSGWFKLNIDKKRYDLSNDDIQRIIRERISEARGSLERCVARLLEFDMTGA